MKDLPDSKSGDDTVLLTGSGSELQKVFMKSIESLLEKGAESECWQEQDDGVRGKGAEVIAGASRWRVDRPIKGRCRVVLGGEEMDEDENSLYNV